LTSPEFLLADVKPYSSLTCAVDSMLQNRSLKSISYLCNILLCSMLAIIRHEFDKCGYG